MKYKNVKNLPYEIAKYYMTGHTRAEPNLIRFIEEIFVNSKKKI